MCECVSNCMSCRDLNTFYMMNGLTIGDGTGEEDKMSFRNVRWGVGVRCMRGEPWVVEAKNEHPCVCTTI